MCVCLCVCVCVCVFTVYFVGNLGALALECCVANVVMLEYCCKTEKMRCKTVGTLSLIWR